MRAQHTGDTPPSLAPELPQPFSDINHKVRRIVFPALETVRIPLHWHTVIVPPQETRDQVVGRMKVVECPGLDGGERPAGEITFVRHRERQKRGWDQQCSEIRWRPHP